MCQQGIITLCCGRMKGAYSFGNGCIGQLGHDGTNDELVPRLIEGVMVAKRVVGVAAGAIQTVVWTDEGEAYSFGNGRFCQLGHGGTYRE